MTNMWDLESLVKAKVKLKNILIDRHIEVDEEDTLLDLVDKVAKIGEDTLVNRLVSNELTEYKNESIENLRPFIFDQAHALINVETPNVVNIGKNAFENSGIRELVILKSGIINTDCVANECRNLKHLILPKFTGISRGYYAFCNCMNLKIVDLNSMVTLDYTFCNCVSLVAVIFRNTSFLTPFSYIQAFNGTQMKNNTGGYIYVPEIMVERYRTATNWSLMASRIIKLEGTIYEDPYWSAKESAYIDVDSVEYELPKDTTVLQFKNTYQIENMYSDGQIMNDEDVLYDFKDTEITTEVK